MSIESHQVTINNRAVHYYEDGIQHGRSILLLHGGLGDATSNWYTMIVELTENYHVIAPDLPNFGDSQALSQPSLDNIITWLLGLLESQGIEQVAVIGHGLGGLIARLMASQHPQTVTALILINGGYVPDVPTWAKALMRLPFVGQSFANLLAQIATSGDSLREIIHHPNILTPEFIATIKKNSSGFASIMHMTATQQSSENKPMVPILILWGQEDQSTSLATGHQLRDALVGSTFVPIEDCGHFPHLEEPDIVDWQIKNFLKQLDPKQRTEIPGL